MVTARWGDEGPFPGDYADHRTPEQRDRDYRAVCRQAGSLSGPAREQAFRRELIEAIQRRRAGREDLVQLELAGGEPAQETLVVRGAVLARAEVLLDERAEQMLRKYDFDREPIECLEGRVVRLRNPELGWERLRDITRLLRRQGHQASLSHVTPLGPVIKGSGGPEPTPGGPAFPPHWYEPGSHGAPAPVAVIDTGITAEVRSDGWLVDVPRTGNIDLLDVLPNGADGSLDFAAGHGTFAAGVVQQIAPGADIRPYQAMDTDGVGSEVGVACAMVTAVDDGATILNLSLGALTLDDQPLVAIEVALELLEERNPEVLVVAAAGNYGTTRPCWPAAFRRVLSVAGLTADLRASEWSSRGFWVDCSTVGQGVVSTFVEGEESPELDPEPDRFPGDAWAVWTGTSFAAPQIAGAVARLCQDGAPTPREALRQLLGGARRIPDFGRAVPLLPGT